MTMATTVSPRLLCNGAVLITLVIMASLHRVAGNADAKRLYDDLINGYNSLIRPVGNNSDRLTVKMGLRLSQLIDVNLKNQIMTTNVWVEQEWNDYKLKWEPEEYGGVSKLHVPAEQIWLPDIVLYNNADGNYEVTIMTKAILHSDGLVIWKPPAIYKSSCQIDVEFFPFDQQVCFMKFGSWTYDGYTVDLKHKYQKGDSSEILIGIDLTEFYLSVEWDIMAVPARRKEKFYSCCEEPYPDITFNVTLRRKTLFYTVNLIIPCILISMLSILVFYLPSESGEKVSLSISIMLSLGVFFLLLIEIIPPTSLTVPLLGRYLLFTMILVTLSVCVSIIIVNVNFRSPATHRMSPWTRKFFLEFLPRVLRINRPDRDNDNDGGGGGVSPNGDNCSPTQQSVQASQDKHLSEVFEKGTLMVPAFNVRRFSGQSCEGSELDDFPPPPPLDKFVLPHFVSTHPGGLVDTLEPMMYATHNGNGHTPPPYNAIVHHHSPVPLEVAPNHGGGMFDEGNLPIDELLEVPNGGNGNGHSRKYRSDLEHALLSVRFMAQHMENLDNYGEVEEDWKFVALVLDRLFLWIFAISCFAGTAGIILQAPTLYDDKQPIDVLYSKVGQWMRSS